MPNPNGGLFPQPPASAAPGAPGLAAGPQDPAFMEWAKQFPGVPPEQLMAAFQSQIPGAQANGPMDKSQFAQPGSIFPQQEQVDPYQNIANKATGKPSR